MRRFAGLILELSFLAGIVQFSYPEADSLTRNRVKPAAGLLSRHALAFNASSHKLYAVDPGSESLIVLSERGRYRANIKVGSSPVAIAINTIKNRIYVANNGSGSISVLDGNSDKVVETLNVGKAPYALAVNETTNRVYVSNTFSKILSVIDAATNSIHTLSIGSADEICIDPIHNEIYLLSYEDEYLTILDGLSESVRRLPAGALHLWDLVLNTASRKAYVTRIGSDDVALIDDTGDAPLVVPTGRMPGALGMDVRRQLLFVANYADNSLTIVDALKQSTVATVHVGEHPQAVVVDSAAGLVYVANTQGSSLSVIDEVSRKVIATLPAGRNPYTLAVDSKNGVVYAANIDRVSVTAIDVSRLRLPTLHRE